MVIGRSRCIRFIRWSSVVLDAFDSIDGHRSFSMHSMHSTATVIGRSRCIRFDRWSSVVLDAFDSFVTSKLIFRARARAIVVRRSTRSTRSTHSRARPRVDEFHQESVPLDQARRARERQRQRRARRRRARRARGTASRAVAGDARRGERGERAERSRARWGAGTELGRRTSARGRGRGRRGWVFDV